MKFALASCTRRMVAVLAVAILPLQSVLAATDAAPADADTVISRYLNAIGGLDALGRIRSRITQTEISFGLATLTVVTQQAWPDRFMEVASIPMLGGTTAGYDGAVAWSQESGERVRKVDGTERGRLLLKHRLDKALQYKTLYPTRTLLGRGSVGGRSAYRLLMKSEFGVETWSFDTGNYLLRQVEGKDLRGRKEIPYTVTLDEYRRIDGILVPFSVITVTDEDEFAATVKSVAHNQKTFIAPPRDLKR